jgi:CRP/FNR family transcriptional regulator, cyclic AMP receptor protein
MLSTLTREQLEKLAQVGVERIYHPGETIVRQAERGLGLYLMLSGRADLRRSGQRIAALSPGQVFGGSALLGDEPRTTEVFAITEVHCFVLNRWNFWGAVGIDPQKDYAQYEATVARLRALQPEQTE